MADIEFLDPGPWQTPAPVPDQHLSAPTASRVHLVRTYAPLLLWAAAGALALIAPFQLVYSVSLHASGFGEDTHADGWGRLRDSNTTFGQHETRYGIVECAAAGLLLIAAGLAGLALARRRSAQREAIHDRDTHSSAARLAAAGIGIAGTALLAGTVATAMLYVATIRDNVQVQLDSAIADPEDQIAPVSTPSLHVSLGWMIWLTVIAVAFGLIALLVQALPQSSPVGPDPDRAALAVVPLAPAPFDPRDELLDAGPPPPPGPPGPHPPIG